MPTVIDCAVWWSEPLEPDDERLGLLDDAERGRYQAYRKESDRRRFLTGRVLARTIVGASLGIAPRAVPLDATCPDCGRPHGRPRVPESDVELSLSHSGDRIGLAITAGVPVGLDAETTDRRTDTDLVGYALNDTERAAIAELSEADRREAFFTYWARKEALMKATGRGLKIPLRSITLSPPGEPPALVGATDPALAGANVTLVDLDPGAGYRACVALLTAERVRVTEHRFSDPRQKFAS